MNPDRIYRQHRDDALALQVTAPEYTTFVAMPFGERFSYRSRKVFDEVICAAADRANQRNEAARPFARPYRGDDQAEVAVVITEDIVVGILESHFFVADLTFMNGGVLLEAGTALGLKPNGQIILLMQGDPRDLHFDIRNNRVICYDGDDPVEKIAKAFIAAAKAFEYDRDRYVESVTKSLSPDAIQLLALYGKRCKDHPEVTASALNRSVMQTLGYDEATNFSLEQIFIAGTKELLIKRLFWTDYRVAPGVLWTDECGMHATDLGWVVIEQMWPQYRRPNPPATPAPHLP